MATGIEKAVDLLKNEDFVIKISECADQAAVIALFKENGADVTAEDLNGLGTLIEAAKDNDGEIPDELAEQVAGGAGGLAKVPDLMAVIGEFLTSMSGPLAKVLALFLSDTSSSSSSSSSSGSSTKKTT